MPYSGEASTSNPNVTESPNYNGGVIQSPEIPLKGKGEPTQRSIRDAGMARNIINLVIQANRNRSIVFSRILAKYNAERPWDSYKLEAEGLGWKQNFSTKPLPTLIEKVSPRFVEMVNGLKYFTNAKLSDKWLNSTEKTEKFRAIITDTIRNRRGWKTLLEDIAFTNSLFGYTAVAWLDEFSWYPVHFKMDELFLPDGTRSESRLCQVAVLKEVLLPHELFKSLKDRQSAEDRGWNLQNARQAINEASPQQVRDRLNVGGTLEFWYQNALRELTIGASYMAGANVVTIYHLLACEVTGKVSHYMLAGPQLLEIFSKDDRFESMENCLSFFTYQKGNGTMHGSKGIGRDLYELCGMIDRTRNESVDRMMLSGKTFVQGDLKRIHTFKMSIVGAMAIVPTGWTFLEQKIDGNVEPFLKLDAYFGMLADQLIGNTSPPTAIQGDAFRSPAAWNVLTQREEEAKDFKLARFLEQFADMVGTMQKRICDPDTDEKDAKAAQERLLTIMTREEIDELAKQPAASVIKDLTPMQRQVIVAIAQEKKGNPLYNQRQLEVEDLTARTDQAFVKRVLLAENDPTQEAEQLRLQQMELELLAKGQPVPVSPRDNHVIHLRILLPIAESAAASVMQGTTNATQLEILSAHVSEHVSQAQSQGVAKELIAPAVEFSNKIGPVLAKLKEIEAQATALMAEANMQNTEMMKNVV